MSAIYLDNKWVLKKFALMFDEYMTPEYSEKFLQFQNVRIKRVAFIRYLIFVGNRLAGVISPYIKGANIKSFALCDEEISKVVAATENFVLTIQELNDRQIYAKDTWDENIIYHNKKLGIIDTSEFYEFDMDKRARDNIKFAMQAVMRSAFNVRKVYGNVIIDYLRISDSRYKKYNDDLSLLQNPRELLLGVKSELEEYLQMPIERFRDAEGPLKRILTKN